VRAGAGGETRALVIKQLDPDVAHRTRLLAQRWLPALELPGIAPRLLGVVADPGHDSVWHLYEDVAGVSLESLGPEREAVTATVEAIARLHVRSASHHVIPECRRDGEDFGIQYFVSNVTDALDLLGALGSQRVRVSPEDAALRDRLRRRLATLLDGAAQRGDLLTGVGGPDAVLHGDLWSHNVLITDSSGEARVRLIDWDHVGAGPICYDLSTLLYRFDRAERPWILERYRAAVAEAGWQLPPTAELNVLCDTCECARYANRIIWPAIALLHDEADWAFAELREIEGWFEALEPLLPEDASRDRSARLPEGYPAGRSAPGVESSRRESAR
jgi:thiamine kinase-like enzyme